MGLPASWGPDWQGNGEVLGAAPGDQDRQGEVLGAALGSQVGQDQLEEALGAGPGDLRQWQQEDASLRKVWGLAEEPGERDGASRTASSTGAGNREDLRREM